MPSNVPFSITWEALPDEKPSYDFERVEKLIPTRQLLAKEKNPEKRGVLEKQLEQEKIAVNADMALFLVKGQQTPISRLNIAMDEKSKAGKASIHLDESITKALACITDDFSGKEGTALVHVRGHSFEIPITFQNLQKLSGVLSIASVWAQDETTADKILDRFTGIVSSALAKDGSDRAKLASWLKIPIFPLKQEHL